LIAFVGGDSSVCSSGPALTPSWKQTDPALFVQIP